MKRAAALLLALLLTFSAAACSSGTSQSSPSPANESASPSAPPGDVISPAASSDKGTVGYITDDVDHYARRTYKIAYLYLDALTLEKAHYTAMQNMQKRLNIEVTDFSAAGDADKFITNIQVCAENGYDGMVIEPNADIHDRIYEVEDIRSRHRDKDTLCLHRQRLPGQKRLEPCPRRRPRPVQERPDADAVAVRPLEGLLGG